MLLGTDLGERQRKMIEEAERSCVRIVALIAELSDIANLDSGAVRFTPESFDLFRLAADVAGDVHEAGDRGVQLSVRGDADGAPMTGDLKRLRAALAAFYRAILREQPSNTTVVVERRRDGAGSAVVVVARDADVARADGARHVPFDEQRGGLGLALPIARRVVEQHAGTVWSLALGDDPETNERRRAVLIAFPHSHQ